METRTYRRAHRDKQSAAAGHEARRARRQKRARQIRRRRATCSLALTAALAGGVMLLAAPGVPAQSSDDLQTKTDLVVTTGDDLVVDTNADPLAPVTACLGDTAAAAKQEGPISAVEDAANGDDDSEEVDINQACSLRMALHAATALSAIDPKGVPGVKNPAGTHAVRILFESDVKEVELTESAPLPPIVGDKVTIDGCTEPDTINTKKSAQGACVNLDFTGQVNNLLDLEVPGPSVAPELMVGLIAAGSETTISGLSFEGDVGTAILSLPTPVALNVQSVTGTLTVQRSWFGITAPGAQRAGAAPEILPHDRAPDVGVQLSARNALVGSTTNAADGNLFGPLDAGVVVAGGSSNVIAGNRFGFDHNGAPITGTKRLLAGVQVRGLGAPGNYYADLIEDAAGVRPVQNLDTTRLAKGNTIGAQLESGGPAQTGVCGPGCNVFGGIKGHAIDVGGEASPDVDQDGSIGLNEPVQATEGDPVGVDTTKIYANRIGVAAAPNDGAGVLVRNGSKGTLVGGDAPNGNVFANNKLGGVVLDGSESLVAQTAAGLETKIVGNVGNSGTAGKQLIDLGGDGVGNEADGPSGGIQAPVIIGAAPTQVTGTAAPNTDIEVYRAASSGRYGDVDAYLGSTTADGDGNWTAKVNVLAGRQVTATADEVGTSELAQNVTVVAPPAPPPPPPPPPPPADVTAPSVKQVMGKDPEAGPVVIKQAPKEFAGEVADESGVAQVKVALQIVKFDRSAKAAPKGKGKAPKCKFVHLSKGTVLERACAAPPFAAADTQATSDGASWELPISKKAQARLRPGRYLLHIQTIDTNGNVDTHTVPLRRKG